MSFITNNITCLFCNIKNPVSQKEFATAYCAECGTDYVVEDGVVRSIYLDFIISNSRGWFLLKFNPPYLEERAVLNVSASSLEAPLFTGSKLIFSLDGENAVDFILNDRLKIEKRILNTLLYL